MVGKASSKTACTLLTSIVSVTEPSEDEKAPAASSKENRTPAVIVRQIRHPSNHISDSGIIHKVKRDKRDLQDDYDDACRDLKILHRENREQSLELRSLKKQNAQLLDTCRSRSEHVDSRREHERDEFYEHVEMLKDQIAYLKQELQRRKSLVESLTVQTREANAEKANAELNVKKLQKQNRDLSENLTECKDDLLRLQPPSVTPDSEIAEQYTSLTQQISRWVDDETEDAQATEARFDALMKNEDLPEALKPYLADGHIQLGKKHPNAQPYIIRYIIHSFLETCMLGNEVYLFGLDTRMISLFEGMERGMHELEPARGKLTPLTQARPPPNN